MLTSSFPAGPDDETCGYIRELARSLSAEFDLTVLAPPDEAAADDAYTEFALVRSGPVLPRAWNPFQAGRDLNELSPALLLASTPAILHFFIYAMKLAPRADIICSNWLVPCGLIGALIARARSKPHVVIEHSGGLHLLMRAPGGHMLATFIVNNSERIIAVSHDLAKKLARLCPQASGKVEIVPMGINAELELAGPAAEPLTALFIGRLVKIKGLDVLLRAAKMVGNLRVVVAGDGPQRAELERLAERLSVEAEFLGRVGREQKRRLLSSCDFVVIPSRRLRGRDEGLPVACLEAMAAGRPIIASRVGGLPEVIADGQNGLLFDPDDHIELAEKLKLLLADGDLRGRLSEGARRTAASYHWSRIGPLLARIFKEIVPGGSTS
jgi:glycosyltransferase involved in cell wall biosynthesis